MSQFGVLLRRYRGQGRDPVRNRPLSQERLGEWLGEVLGDAGYTGAAVSEWERGRSRISHTQRPVLVALIRVLYLAGGLTDRAAADAFLAAGDYRPLDEAERRRITPHWAVAHRPSEEGWGWAIALGLAELAARPWQWLRERPGGGAPEPLDWTDVALAGLRQLGGLLAHRTRWRPWTWFVVWWAVWRWACPPLHPAAAADAHPFQTALTLYAGAACALPAVIAGLVPARTPQSLAARLYVHQGAYLGFHLGTLGLSLAGLLNYHLGFEPWSEEVQWVLAGGWCWPRISAPANIQRPSNAPPGCTASHPARAWCFSSIWRLPPPGPGS